jgi:organic radical activating enzyme
MTRTAIVYIEERCNQSCVFCLEEDGSWSEFVAPNTEQVEREIDRLRARGAEQITFMGGETFFRKDLPQILRHARSVGMRRLGVTTNGTVLSKPGFVGELAEAGLDCVEISIHAHTPELAEAISRNKVTFPRQAKAMAEIDASQRLYTIVNVVVCHENAGNLIDVAGYVLDSMPNSRVRFKFKFVSLQGWAADRAGPERVALSYAEVPFIELGDFLEARGASFWFYNVPLCRLGRHAKHSHELSTLAADETYFDRDHRGDGTYYNSDYQLEGRVWPAASCRNCTLSALCPGIEETYRLANGETELTRSSSDPLPLVEFALADRELDPAQAAESLARIDRRPRPSVFIRPRPDGAVRFLHAAYEVPFDLILSTRREDQRYFFATAHFALSYRSSYDLGQHPEIERLLTRATEVLRAAEVRCATLDAVRRDLVAMTDPSWKLAPETDLPARSLKANQLRLAEPLQRADKGGKSCAS